MKEKGNMISSNATVIVDKLKALREILSRNKEIVNKSLSAFEFHKEKHPQLADYMSNLDIPYLCTHFKEKFDDQEERLNFKDMVKEETLLFLISLLPTISVDPVTGVRDEVAYEIGNLTLERFEIDKKSVQLKFLGVPAVARGDTFFQVTVKDIHARLKDIEWAFKQEYFPYMSGNGVADALLQDCTIQFGVQLCKTGGCPQVLVSSCDVFLGVLDLEVRNTNFGWLMNALSVIVSDRLRLYIQSLLQETLVGKMSNYSYVLNSLFLQHFDLISRFVEFNSKELPEAKEAKKAVYEGRLRKLLGVRRDIYTAVFENEGPIGLSFIQKDEYVAVKQFPRSSKEEKLPAELSGEIRVGDVLVAYNGQDVTSLPLAMVIARMKSSDRPLYLTFQSDQVSTKESEDVIIDVSFDEPKLLLVIGSIWGDDDNRKHPQCYSVAVKGFRSRPDGSLGPAQLHNVQVGMVVVGVNNESTRGQSFAEVRGDISTSNRRPLVLSFSQPADYYVEFQKELPSDLIMGEFEDTIVVTGMSYAAGAAERQAGDKLVKGMILMEVNGRLVTGSFKEVVHTLKKEPRPMKIGFGRDNVVTCEVVFDKGPLGMIFYQTSRGEMAFKHFSKLGGPARSSGKIQIGDALIAINGVLVHGLPNFSALPLKLEFRKMGLLQKLKEKYPPI